jgi:hypothetical protein
LGGVTEQFRGDVCVSSHSILPRNEFPDLKDAKALLDELA